LLRQPSHDSSDFGTRNALYFTVEQVTSGVHRKKRITDGYKLDVLTQLSRKKHWFRQHFFVHSAVASLYEGWGAATAFLFLAGLLWHSVTSR
jgi:hypothetical protein